VVSASALSEKVERLAQIPCEVWGKTDFADTDRILAILQQRRIVLEQQFVNAGHAAAMARLGTQYSVAAVMSGWVSGVDYYRFLKELLANWDARKDEVSRRLAQVAARVFTANNVAVSFVGSARDLDAYWAAGGELGLPHVGESTHKLEIPAPAPANEAFVIPSNVCYVGAGTGKSRHDVDNLGLWSVCQRVLSYDYLWNEVRVKGGAYGCGFRHNTNGLAQFWSYRDPAVDPTSARFEGAGDWLSHWDPSEEDFEGFIVATVAALDAPLGARMLARRQDGLFLSERPEGWRDLIRAQHLAATPEKVRAVAPSLTKLADQSAFCVFGGREQIEASGLDLDVVELMG
jgi:Zn-dependent M16 (insulinase) family peptidase